MSIQFLTETRIHNPLVCRIQVVIPIVLFGCLSPISTQAQRLASPGSGRRAVVVDERLAVLRDAPSLSAGLLKRLSRGRQVSVLTMKRSPEGVVYYRVAVTRRTRGWMQREAVVSPTQKGDDDRLLTLIRASKDFDRVARASIFLETFPKSTFRPAVLLLFAEAVEEAARKLTNEAARRLDTAEIKANRATTLSYFLNFNGLDRYQRLRIKFAFDEVTKQYHYDGAAWREIVRKYPRTTEAVEAGKRLDSLGLRMTQKGK